jgi:hypothetical protein
MKLVYQGPEPLLQLNIGDKVIYYRGVPFEAEGGYAECLLSKLHPHRFAVVDEPVSEATAVAPTTKRVGRKPKE